ncbi:MULTISPECIES: TIGR02710 family CRISPR-associated CARF protein [unclassified Synechococcus]|uniref:TIGR02710 family CRISPR-associated CARF protein n=1 Tax=unclassified Synechococcus TaxID=2626047 RepID=UPI0021A57B81|nr:MULTISPECIES: TIGR02710 family CRISPR-associated CARF protein [unclassified Synechococcus]MCT0212425.1 TIGR02710 family CRISPR-associated protein [Synechococcus sp. CS-1326]MCT0234608.1 TIGR02710 family CRISPR-associated protein [Synechococcus sp. CS-1327]
MTRTLVLTVGQSDGPIVNCLNSVKPDRAVFLCSSGSRAVVDAVVAQVDLPDFDPERDVLELQQRLGRNQGGDVVNSLDRLDHVYLQARDLLDRLRQENPGAKLSVDYTGGTKTMATGLAMAAVDDGQVDLLLTTTNRPSAGVAISGPSLPVPVALGSLQIRRLLEAELPPLLRRYDYAAAREAVVRVRLLLPQGPQATELTRLEQLLQAFDAWDRFDHKAAADLLGLQAGDPKLQALLLELKRVIHSRRQLDETAEREQWPAIRGHGQETVEDLLLNAERRAKQQRYDDAVGRLYRAMELTAQLLLKREFNQLTAAVDLEQVPASVLQAYTLKQYNQPGGGALRLGMSDSFDLLAAYEHPVGMAWAEQRSALVDQLKLRNASLFAHGFQPISAAGWKSLRGSIGVFLSAAIATASGTQPRAHGALSQFPASLEELGVDRASIQGG